MNNQDHYRIHTIELSVSIMAYIIGVGVLTIPRVLAQELETTDGWISIAISGTLVMILITLYTRLQRNFPGKNLIQYLGDGPIGKWWAKSLSILFVIYFISLATWEVRILTVVVKLYLLDQTPSEVIAASILLLSTYAVHKGWQGVIHLNLVFMPIILFVILGVIALNISAFRLEALRPVLAEGISPVLISLKDTLLSYVGFEIIFFFMAYITSVA